METLNVNLEQAKKMITLGGFNSLSWEISKITTNLEDLETEIRDEKGQLERTVLINSQSIEKKRLDIRKKMLTACTVVELKQQKEFALLGNRLLLEINDIEKTFILDRYSLDKDMIGLDSDLGEKLFGKKAGDKFMYLNGKGQKNTCLVKEIFLPE